MDPKEQRAKGGRLGMGMGSLRDEGATQHLDKAQVWKGLRSRLRYLQGRMANSDGTDMVQALTAMLQQVGRSMDKTCDQGDDRLSSAICWLPVTAAAAAHLHLPIRHAPPRSSKRLREEWTQRPAHS